MFETVWFWIGMLFAGMIGVLVWCLVLYRTLELLRKRKWL